MSENKPLKTIVESYEYCTGEKVGYSLIVKELKDKLAEIPQQTICDFLIENKIKLKKTFEKKIERDGYFKSTYFAVRYLSGIIKREIEKGWSENPLSKTEALIKNAGDTRTYVTNGSTYKRTRRPLCELFEGTTLMESEDINDR